MNEKPKKYDRHLKFGHLEKEQLSLIEIFKKN